MHHAQSPGRLRYLLHLNHIWMLYNRHLLDSYDTLGKLPVFDILGHHPAICKCNNSSHCLNFIDLNHFCNWIILHHFVLYWNINTLAKSILPMLQHFPLDQEKIREEIFFVAHFFHATVPRSIHFMIWFYLDKMLYQIIPFPILSIFHSMCCVF